MMNPLIVVDVGCRWGFAERFTNSHANRFTIFGFDPDREECERLENRYLSLTSCSVKLVPIALAGKAGKRKLYITHDPACSSLLQPIDVLTKEYPALHCAQLVRTVEVETTTLDDWAREEGILSIDYLKLDTQGTELEILLGGSRLLKTVRCIEIEVEFNQIYQEQPLFADIDIELRKRGFVLWKLTNQAHYSHGATTIGPLMDDMVHYDLKDIAHPIYGGQLYWANAHYVNKEVLNRSGLSLNQQSRDSDLFNALGMRDVILTDVNI